MHSSKLDVMKRYFQNKYFIFWILLLSLIVRLLYLLFDWPLWWDSHLHVLMGKYIFSSGALGIFEYFRAPLFPIVLGFFWKIGFDPFFMGKVLDVTLSLLCVYLTYLIGKKIFDEQIGLLSAFLLSLTPIFISITGLILADPLALALGLLGMYIIIRKENFMSSFLGGVLLSFSFLARFPCGIWFFATLLCFLLLQSSFKEKLKKSSAIIAGFLLIQLPYLYFNYVHFNNPLKPFITGSYLATTATWLFGGGSFYYFREFFIGLPIYLFFFVGLYLAWKEKWYKHKQKLLVILIPLLTILYFIYLPRKEVRYMLIALPFFSMVCAYTLRTIYLKLKMQQKPFVRPQAFVVICILLLLLPYPSTLAFERTPTFEKETKEIILAHNVQGPIVTTNPGFISSFDLPFVTLDGAVYAAKKYEDVKEKYDLMIIDDCDLLCNPSDAACLDKKKVILSKIKEENKEVFSKNFYLRLTKEICLYSVYVPLK